MNILNQEIRNVPLAEIQEHPNNARRGDMGAIQYSVDENGFWGTIVVQKSTGFIVAGNHRYRAAREAGFKEVPVAFVDVDDTKAKKILAADNRTSDLGDYDNEALAHLLDDLNADEHLAGTGYNVEDLDDLINGLSKTIDVSAFKRRPPQSKEETEPVPEPPKKPITKPGDIWQLGEHRVMCGDSTKADDVARLMDGKTADMVFTDPPYGMFLKNDRSDLVRTDPSGWKSTPKKYKNVIGDHEDFSPDLIQAIFAAAPDAKEVFIWGADYFAELLPNRNDGSWVAWDKRVDQSLDTMMGSMFELCWSKVRHKREIARIRWVGFHGTEQEHDHKRVHPTQKPTALAEWFFEKWGAGLNIILDLFGGSGSTLIACEKTSRHCRMMELDPAYVDVIVERWENLTGQKATKLPT